VGDDEVLDLIEHDGVAPVYTDTPIGRVTYLWPMRTEPRVQGVVVDEGQLYGFSPRGDH